MFHFTITCPEHGVICRYRTNDAREPDVPLAQLAHQYIGGLCACAHDQLEVRKVRVHEPSAN